MFCLQGLLNVDATCLSPGSGSFSLSGSADMFLGVPGVNGEQSAYQMGGQVRTRRSGSASAREAKALGCYPDCGLYNPGRAAFMLRL